MEPKIKKLNLKKETIRNLRQERMEYLLTPEMRAIGGADSIGYTDLKAISKDVGDILALAGKGLWKVVHAVSDAVSPSNGGTCGGPCYKARGPYITNNTCGHSGWGV